jgi:hypothetical protein
MRELIISFESTNFAMQTEAYLKNIEIKMQIMPTPREITLSCGLSIKTSVDNLTKIRELVDKEIIKIKGIYMLIYDDIEKKIEKIE